MTENKIFIETIYCDFCDLTPFDCKCDEICDNCKTQYIDCECEKHLPNGR